MKKVLVAAIAFLAIASCTVSKDCTTPRIFSFNLIPAAGNYISEDSATVIQFTKDGNFSEIEQQTTAVLQPGDSGKMVLISYVNQPENYDWKIILIPSGRTYIIKDIHFSNDHVEQSRFNKKDVVCFNKVFYTVNNQVNMFDPIQQTPPATDAYLPLDY